MTELLLLLALAASDPPDLQALIRAGKLDEAEQALEDLPEAARLRFDGLIALERGDPARAVQAFVRASEMTSTPDPALLLHLAHAHLLAGQPAAALSAAEAAKAVEHELIAQPLLRARALRALERPGEAFAILTEAAERFAAETRPLLELIALAHESGLLSLTRRWAEDLLRRADRRLEGLDLDTALALVHLLAEDERALGILEGISARRAERPELLVQLAFAYAHHGYPYAAGKLFERASALGEDRAFEAADQYRMAGRYRSANRMNARVQGKERRRRQRLTILFEARSYARVATFPNPPIDEASTYRRAYAHYALGHRSQAATLARALLKKEGSYATSARALLEAMGLEAEVP